MKYQANRNYKSNDVIMTPKRLAKEIVKHFKPSGVCLEPCKGTGNIYNLLPKGKLWCEISRKKDFMHFKGEVDWIITNPPWSKVRDFLNKSMMVSKNICFLMTINHIWTRARLRDIRNRGFGIKEIMMVNTPKEFPQLGFQLGVIYLKKGYKGKIRLTEGKEAIKKELKPSKIPSF